MNFLIDEQLSARLVPGLSALSSHRFTHIRSVAPERTLDKDIPPLCQRLGIEALLTLNIRDFGARVYYYRALLESGVDVVVGRWQQKNAKPTAGKQLALFASHYETICRYLIRAENPTLVVVTPSECRERNLAQLVDEVEGQQRRRLP